MIDPLRQEVAATAQTVVVKIGTRPLTHDNGTLNLERIEQLAAQIHSLLDGRRKVVLVSSGAVSAGMGQLGLSRRPTDLAHLQAIAAIGQAALVQAYDRALRPHGRHAAQVLLIADDLHHRTRYLNVRNTLITLLELGAVPIINENDTVSVEELQTTFGDNDRLAALVSDLLGAQLLVILSDVAGLYDRDPQLPDAQVIPTVTRITPQILGLVNDTATLRSKGGMMSKLMAARMATSGGQNVVIASGTQPDVLSRIFRGELVGTLFLAGDRASTARKRWIAFGARPRGAVQLDDGACRALCRQGRSLLAAGIVAVEGDFAKGDIISLLAGDGREFARGLTNYPAHELRRIKGLRTGEIAEVLGHRPYDEVVHRDNLAMLD